MSHPHEPPEGVKVKFVIHMCDSRGRRVIDRVTDLEGRELPYEVRSYDEHIYTLQLRGAVYGEDHHRAVNRIAELEGQVTEARSFGEEAARKYNDLLAQGRIVRCAFCDAAYPPDTPPTQHEALVAHVKVCPQHPVREAEERIADLEEQVADWKARATAPDGVSDNALDMARAFVRGWFGHPNAEEDEETAELARMFEAFQREARTDLEEQRRV